MGEYVPNPTAASILGFLHEGSMTGWDLLVLAQLRIGEFWSLTTSQVYRELSSMAAAGLIEAGERGPRDRRPYTITDTGRAAFARWAAEDPGSETIRIPLLLAISLGAHIPTTQLQAALVRHQARHVERLRRYTQLRTMPGLCDDDIWAQATLDFGIAYEQATLDWFAALPPEITGQVLADKRSAEGGTGG